jgi:hypothetical protein
LQCGVRCFTLNLKERESRFVLFLNFKNKESNNHFLKQKTMKTTILLTAFFFFTAQLSYGQWSYSDLSAPRSYMGSTTLGNKAYFAGGRNGSNLLTLVEEYDVTKKTWNITGNLSVARAVTSGIACGSKLFFAGGTDWSDAFSTVDIFDTTTQKWSTAQLSVPRFSIAAVSDSIKVLFAGGFQLPSGVYQSVVDIYDIQTGVWTKANLSLAREAIATAVVGNLAIFAGGYGASSTTDVVDIYNFSTNKWSKDKLSQARGFASATTIGSKVIIAGGITSLNNPTNRVDIFDTTTGIWTTASLSVPRAAHGNAVTINGKAYFVGGGIFMGDGYITPSDVVDIYNPVSNTWSIDFLTQPIMAHSVVGVGNQFLVAGGLTNGDLNVKKVEIFSIPTGITSNQLVDKYLKIYPNPVSEKITVEFPGWGQTTNGTVTIYGIAGQQVISQKINGFKSEIAVNNLPAGLYFIKLVSNNKTGIGKFVKN